MGARPSTSEAQQFKAREIMARAKTRQAAFEDVIWALINTKEFILVQ